MSGQNKKNGFGPDSRAPSLLLGGPSPRWSRRFGDGAEERRFTMWPSSLYPRLAAVIATVGALALGGLAQAQTAPQEQTTPGSFCPVAQLRINGVPGKVLKE